MKMKFILASAVVCAVGSIFYLSQPDQVADFAPRQNTVSEEARGAAEVLKKLRANVETGEVEASDIIRMKKAYRSIAKHAPKTVDMSWEQMGPNNIGGRTRAILAVNNTTIYAGSVSGGLWRSTNAGNNWNMIESFPGVPVSCIDMTVNGTIFVGTGTSYDGSGGEGQSGFVGTGLYMSDDGENWELVPGTLPTFLSNGADWSYIDELAADPNSPDKMWIAFNDGLGYYDVGTGTLFDPGEEGPLPGLPNSACGDVQISPAGELMVASVGSRCYRSLDGGQSWLNMSSGTDPNLLPQASIGRIELAIAPSDPTHVYALIASQFGSLRGGYYSTNSGETWTQGWPGGVPEIDLFGSNSQGVYDNILTVDPNDPTRCLAGGVTLWKFGSTSQPEQIALNFTFPGSPLYVHSDIHEFEWAPNGDLYIGTDGGIHKSTDGGQTFITANRNYITTQFYGIAYTPDGGVIGGTQDNGTWYVPYDGSLSELQNGADIFGGDGFDCEVSQLTEIPTGVAFATSQYGVMSRLTQDGGGGSIFDADIEALRNPDNGRLGQFYTTVRLYENTEDENSQQFIEVVNPFGETVTSTAQNPVTLELTTENQALPFSYTLPEGQSLEFYEELIRPAFVSPTLITEDPDYFWLSPQPLDSAVNNCVFDSTLVSIEQIIVGYDYQDTTVYFENVVIINGVEITVIDSATFVVDSIPQYELNFIYDVSSVCDSAYYYKADTIFNMPGRIRVQDQYTSMLAVGFVGTQGVWLTREGLDFNTTPDWWQIIPNLGSGQSTKALEFTKDGKHLFVSTWGGRLYRVSGLDQLWANSNEPNDVDLSVLTVTQIFSSPGGVAITGVASDPNDADHLVITIGGYGGNQKVRASENATSNNPTFTSIWNPPSLNGNELFGLPVYDAVIDMTDSDIIIVGTEFGMFATDDHGDTWSIVNNGDMDPTPVFDVRQQFNTSKRFQYPTNTGVVYAGSHGRGIFQSSDIVSVNEVGSNGLNLRDQLLVYPNPANSIVQADINLRSTSDVNIEIYSITGKRVYNKVMSKMGSGTHTLRVPVSSLSIGNYIMVVEANGLSETAKFVISR